MIVTGRKEEGEIILLAPKKRATGQLLLKLNQKNIFISFSSDNMELMFLFIYFFVILCCLLSTRHDFIFMFGGKKISMNGKYK